MKNTKFERVRGLNDVLPDICSTDQQIESVLQQNFAVFGYRPIDVPLLEQTELYLKKAGEDIVDRLYDFTYRNRRLCLRPEMTASVVRSYVDNLQSAPLPLRLYYHGAAFRYERPQKGRFRQFTQMGIELIGANDIMADAEVIAIACQGLDKLGLENYQVVIAHIGVLNKFLDQLQIESRLRSFLLANMEVLQKQGRQEVEKRLHKLYPSFAVKNDDEETTQTNSKLVKMLQGMTDQDAKTAILDLLSSMNIQLSSTREPAEIVERLLHKIHREDETKIINQVLDFMQDLGKIAGEPATAMTAAKQLLTRYQIEDSALDQLQEIINTLQNYHLDHSKITINFGMSRGLQYYTGMIFEIHHNSNDEMQIAGGGRYDDLINVLGGKQETPATGFSYGLERLRMALEIEGKLPNITHTITQVLIIPVNKEDQGYAIAIADQLRQENIKVEIDVRNRNLSSNFQYADKQNIPYTIVIGKEERNSNQVVFKNIKTREQITTSLENVISRINSKNLA